MSDLPLSVEEAIAWCVEHQARVSFRQMGGTNYVVVSKWRSESRIAPTFVEAVMKMMNPVVDAVEDVGDVVIEEDQTRTLDTEPQMPTVPETPVPEHPKARLRRLRILHGEVKQ